MGKQYLTAVSRCADKSCKVQRVHVTNQSFPLISGYVNVGKFNVWFEQLDATVAII